MIEYFFAVLVKVWLVTMLIFIMFVTSYLMFAVVKDIIFGKGLKDFFKG